MLSIFNYSTDGKKKRGKEDNETVTLSVFIYIEYRVYQKFCDISKKLFYFKKKQSNKTMRHQFESYNRVLWQLSMLIENRFTIMVFDRTYSTKKNDDHVPHMIDIDFFDRFFNFPT